MKGWMYILKCVDDSYYTGSTNNLELRLAQHQSGEGANYTAKRLPIELVYFEEYNRIDEAFYREKQVQGWCRKKKEALIAGMPDELHEFAKCLNETSHCRFDTIGRFDSAGFGSAQPAEETTSVAERSQRCRSHEQKSNNQCNLVQTKGAKL